MPEFLDMIGIKAIALPDQNAIGLSSEKMTNTLGKIEGEGYPDAMLIAEKHPDLNGVVVDYYQSTGGSANGIREMLGGEGGKCIKQSSVIILDLRESSVPLTEVLKTIDEHPIPGLRILLVIEKDATALTRIDYPATEFNKPVYGRATVTEDGLRTERLESPPEFGTEIVRDYPPELADGAEYLQIDVPGGFASSNRLTATEVEALWPMARQFWLDHGALASALADVAFSVDDLPSLAVAQTTGSHITLSPDAAGWGWFIDGTPAENEEFAQIGSTLEYRAKAGSAAEAELICLAC